jgi:hypothetical protein
MLWPLTTKIILTLSWIYFTVNIGNLEHDVTVHVYVTAACSRKLFATVKEIKNIWRNSNLPSSARRYAMKLEKYETRHLLLHIAKLWGNITAIFWQRLRINSRNCSENMWEYIVQIISSLHAIGVAGLAQSLQGLAQRVSIPGRNRAHSTSKTMCCFPEAIQAGAWIRLHRVLRLIMLGAIPPLPHASSCSRPH